MIKDLPGQAVLFPELEPREEADAQPARTVSAAGVQAAPMLGLPNKATCTASEAHRCTGYSVRQLRYFVADGSLLAINAARVPVGKRTGKGKGRNINSWRIVVRRSPEFLTDNCKMFQTLEEFLLSRTNRES